MSSDKQQLGDVALDSWQSNATYWDGSIGKDGNMYWKKLQEPSLRRLIGTDLNGRRALDLATGNGIGARWLAKQGAVVTATDGSENMLQIARSRTVGEEGYETIAFEKLDVTQLEDFERFIAATGENKFDTVLMNMAIMDVSTLEPLVHSLPKLLKPNGVFVATILHPVFMTSEASRNVDLRYEGETGDLKLVRTKVIEKYLDIPPYKGIAIPGQPKRQIYFHRPMEELFTTFFRAGLVMDAMEEPAFSAEDAEKGRIESTRNYTQLPAILSFRMRLPNKIA